MKDKQAEPTMADIMKNNSELNELNTVVKAGEILMQSGAEIYRVEETMAHMAAALKISDFNAYAVNGGIFASGTNKMGIQEAKIANVPDSTIDLGKIEAINSLSREISEGKNLSLEELSSRLQEIGKEIVDPLWGVLLTYFIGAVSFSIAVGSSWLDSFVSSICGLIMGLVFYAIRNHIRTPALKTIIVSSVVTISANLLCQFGVGEHRGLIILGCFMLLVPGATFTNAVREFSQNNYSTGVTLLMSATLTCISMAVGVVLATDFLPFANHMTEDFPTVAPSIEDIVIRTIMIGFGTVAFSFLFHAPKHRFLDQGILGSMSFLLHVIINMLFEKEIVSIFITVLTITFFSRFLAVKRKCPATIFLSISIFPLIPGLTFYRGVYFLMTRNEILGWNYMRGCFVSAFVIAIAIALVQQIPGKLFQRIAG